MGLPRITQLFRQPIPDHTILHFFFQHWVPGIVSFLVGGVLISLLMPYIQADFETARHHQQRRLEISEQIAQDFGPYITNWRRLRLIATRQATHGLSEPEKERRDQYVMERDKAKDKLYATLERTRIYFDAQTVTMVDAFMTWDNAQASASLGKLPPLREWQVWRDRLVKQLVNEVNPDD